MNKLLLLSFISLTITVLSCSKEYSIENSSSGNDQIVGNDCRMSKVIYTDTAAKKGIGSIEAVINSADRLTRVIKFDSVSNTIEYFENLVYSGDTAFISPDEYFIVDANQRVSKLHGLIDPTDPFSPQYDIFYGYNAGGYLVTKNYFFTVAPTFPFYQVQYTYLGGNLTHMTATDLTNNELVFDADMTYIEFIVPKRYLYVFPDEMAYNYFNQFFNFGQRNLNAISKITVRNYDPGNVVRDSVVSTFSNYVLSRDGYVLSVQMGGNDQEFIPASAGKLSFSYSCK